MFKRTRYQFGWLRKKSRKRGPDVLGVGLLVNYASCVFLATASL
jgi:hypothetical protein